MSDLSPGTLIDNRYEIISQLGEGGMGVVFEALHQEMHRSVALKVLKTQLAQEPEKIARFRQEARVMSSLDHPNIVSVYSIGVSEIGSPYIAMELLKGKSLGEIIAQHGAMPYQAALPIFIQVCAALSHAHSKGVIHRDVKPSNFIIVGHDQGSQVKVLDFGIAKLLDANQDLTQTTAVVGSVFYMSPGQIEGRGAEPQSDIYSLGSSLFEALAGRPPFQSDNHLATIAAKRATTAPTVAAVNPGAAVPEALEAVIARCLRRDPAERYQSVAELQAHLESILGGAEETVVLQLKTLQPNKKRGEFRPSKRSVLIGSVMLALGLMALAAYLVMHNNQQLVSSNDPYDLPESSLRSLVEQRLQEVDDGAQTPEGWAKSAIALKEAELIRARLPKDAYLDALISHGRGHQSVAKTVSENDAEDVAGWKECLGHLKQSIASFEQARHEQLSAPGTAAAKQQRAVLILRKELWVYLEMQIAASGIHLTDEVSDIAAKIIEIGMSPGMVLESREVAAVKRSFPVKVRSDLNRHDTEAAVQTVSLFVRFCRQYKVEDALVKQEVAQMAWMIQAVDPAAAKRASAMIRE